MYNTQEYNFDFVTSSKISFEVFLIYSNIFIYSVSSLKVKIISSIK